jgi:tetratricopeptide (TPR) repeat protein
MTDLLAQSKEAYESNRIKEAKEICEKLIEKEPDNALAYQQLGRCWYKMGQDNKAFQALSKAIELDPHLSSAYALLGSYKLAKGEIKDGLIALNKALEIDPNSVTANFSLGHYCLSQKEFDKAAEHFNRIIKTEPSRWEGYYGLGVLYCIRRQYKKSRRMLKKAARLKPKSPSIRSMLRLTYIYQFSVLVIGLFLLSFLLPSLFASSIVFATAAAIFLWHIALDRKVGNDKMALIGTIFFIVYFLVFIFSRILYLKY